MLLQAWWNTLWRNLQCLCAVGETLEETPGWIQKELESCKLPAPRQGPLIRSFLTNYKHNAVWKSLWPKILILMFHRWLMREVDPVWRWLWSLRRWSLSPGESDQAKSAECRMNWKESVSKQFLCVFYVQLIACRCRSLFLKWSYTYAAFLNFGAITSKIFQASWKSILSDQV